MIVKGNAIQAEGLNDFFENLGQMDIVYQKKWQKSSENPGRTLLITAIIASAATSRNPQVGLSTLPDVIKFYQTGK